jgi:hypothetical protein
MNGVDFLAGFLVGALLTALFVLYTMGQSPKPEYKTVDIEGMTCIDYNGSLTCN